MNAVPYHLANVQQILETRYKTCERFCILGWKLTDDIEGYVGGYQRAQTGNQQGPLMRRKLDTGNPLRGSKMTHTVGTAAASLGVVQSLEVNEHYCGGGNAATRQMEFSSGLRKGGGEWKQGSPCLSALAYRQRSYEFARLPDDDFL